MTPSSRSLWFPAGWCIALCAAVVLTNRYQGPPADPTFIPGDAYSYFALARAAPGLPSEVLPPHHAQRIALPYLIGVAHRVIPIQLHLLFLGAVVLLELAVLILCSGILQDLKLSLPQASMVVAVLAFNPWAFREYLTFPEMVTDLGFVFGLAVLLRGLVRASPTTAIVGQFIASASRQTALLLVPMVLVWLWRAPAGWSTWSVHRRRALGLALATVPVVVYVATDRLVAGFSEPNVGNDVIVLGLFRWLAADFDAAVLAQFAGRALLAPLIPVAMLAALMLARRPYRGTSTLQLPLMIGAICIWAQPLLSGPVVTGGNAPRLIALGLIPACLAVGTALRDTTAFANSRAWKAVAIVIALLALGSLHHLYVAGMEPSGLQKAAFGAAHVSAAAGCFVALTRGVRATT